jgi:hypothetical protein
MSLGSGASRGGEEAPSRSGPGGEDAFQESVAEGHTPVASLRAFRARLHASFNKRADALFELADAILTAGSIPSPPHLSLTPVHRRGWASLYAALSKGRIEERAVRGLLARYPMVHDDKDRTPVYAVDVTPWPLCDAEASPERGFCYHPDTRQVSPSSPAGHTNSSPRSASPATPGWRPWTSSGSILQKTKTLKPLSRYAPCWSGGHAGVPILPRLRLCSSLTPDTTP